jgi:hypothetical protein
MLLGSRPGVTLFLPTDRMNVQSASCLMNIKPVAAAIAITLTAIAAPARADETTLDTYYAGEQTSAYVIGSIGAAAAASGGVLVSRPTELERTLGWTWIGWGGVEAIGAVAYTVQVHREIRGYAAMAAHDPTRYRAVEIDHIRGVGARFSGYRVTELALVVGGAAAASYGFASGHQGWQGVGVGVASLSLPLAIIDTLNDRRAHRYLQSLERATQTVTVAPIASPGSGRAAGAALGVGGRF